MLDVEGTSALKLAAAAYGRAPAEVKKAIRDASKVWAPKLKKGVSERVALNMPAQAQAPMWAVARSARTSTNSRGLVATFGASGTFHGTPTRRLAAPFEFGGDRRKYEQYISRQRQTKQRIYVNRRAQAQLPMRRKKGYAIFPTVTDLTPELVAMWIRVIIDATTGGRQYAG